MLCLCMVRGLKLRKQWLCQAVKEVEGKTAFDLILCKIKIKIFLLEVALTGTTVLQSF